jgi:Leishmanolysin
VGRSWRLVTVTGSAVVAAVAAAVASIALNVATGGKAPRFPSVDQHYLWWLAGSTGAVAASGLLGWWTQRRYERGLVALVPVAQRPESWVVDRPVEVDRIVGALRRGRGAATVGITTAVHGAAALRCGGSGRIGAGIGLDQRGQPTRHRDLDRGRGGNTGRYTKPEPQGISRRIAASDSHKVHSGRNEPVSEIYYARADAERALLLAETTSPFTIAVRFVGGLSQGQMDAFAAAADRWVKVIVGDLPDVVIDGEPVDDVLIIAEGKVIDGPGATLAHARITHVRPRVDEPWALLPARGEMAFDKADLERMEADGSLGDVITHEMGHILGIGGLWAAKGLLVGAGTADPTFSGPAAMAEYHKLLGASGEPVRVPVENTGGPGTREVHWRDADFANELMTGFVNRPPNPLSRVTVASLGDLGYQVDVDAADDFQFAEISALVDMAGRVPCHSVAVPTVLPVELPRESVNA